MIVHLKYLPYYAIVFALTFSSFLTICNGQNALSVGLPFCKFTGEGVDNTSYIPGFIANYQKHVPLNSSGKSLVLLEAGIFVIGTKQEYQSKTYKAKVSGIDFGLFYKQKFLDAQSTPYALFGINLRAMMKDEPELAIKQDNITTVKAFYHRVLLPELVFGAGYSIPLGNGELGLEIRDNLGLRAIDDDGTIKSNTISLCLVFVRN